MRVLAAWAFVLFQAAILPLATASQAAVIYPSGPAVPENILRIEVRFSQSLPTPLEPTQVRLLDQNGQEIQDALLDLMLPSADGKRITILMHPGRVKSGVGANLALGRALHSGSTITLVLTHPAFARPLTKTWAVGASDTTPPQPERWTFTVPALRSRDALVVHMDKAISATADVLIAVRDAQGELVPGSINLDGGETIWRFIPAHSWQVGAYALVIHPDLEDAAGNRACATFELTRQSKVPCDTATTLPFEIKERRTENSQ